MKLHCTEMLEEAGHMAPDISCAQSRSRWQCEQFDQGHAWQTLPLGLWQVQHTNKAQIEAQKMMRKPMITEAVRPVQRHVNFLLLLLVQEKVPGLPPRPHRKSPHPLPTYPRCKLPRIPTKQWAVCFGTAAAMHPTEHPQNTFLATGLRQWTKEKELCKWKHDGALVEITPFCPN